MTVYSELGNMRSEKAAAVGVKISDQVAFQAIVSLSLRHTAGMGQNDLPGDGA